MSRDYATTPSNFSCPVCKATVSAGVTKCPSCNYVFLSASEARNVRIGVILAFIPALGMLAFGFMGGKFFIIVAGLILLIVAGAFGYLSTRLSSEARRIDHARKRRT